MGWGEDETENSCFWELKAASDDKRLTMINQINLAKHCAPHNGIARK